MPLVAILRRGICPAVAFAAVVLLMSAIDASPLAAQEDAASPPQWRRTVNGWERADLWEVSNYRAWEPSRDEPASRLPLLHPIVVALLQLVVSVAALLLLPSRPKSGRKAR